MVGRILRSADFQRVLAASPRSRSTHFAAHHLPVWPSVPAKPVRKAGPKAVSPELSTGDALSCPPPVDDQPAAVAQPAPAGCWLGLVVPKRHAKRSVTRNLLKRQMRAVMGRFAAAMPPGLWVLRLKSPFDRKEFLSPASTGLQEAVRAELQTLFERALAPRR